MLKTRAVVIEAPEVLGLRELALVAPKAGDVVVEIDYSGISTGTERLLYDGRMPMFPGMGYPLVPGYESVGRIVDAGADQRSRIGQTVFVPGSNGFVDARGLFGGAAHQLVTSADRAVELPTAMAEQGVLLALAATAFHALHPSGEQTPVLPDLIIGHGVVGRLLARLTCALGGLAPSVWEQDAGRRNGAFEYPVIDPADDERRDYRCVVDASGDSAVIDAAVSRLAKNGEIVLAGFYPGSLSFAFAPAFMREARIRIAAEWQTADMHAVLSLANDSRLSLAELITHRHAAFDAASAYHRAFKDPQSIKTILDWRAVQ